MKKLVAFSLLLSACASGPSGNLSESQYERIVRRYTRSADKYNGLYQTFQASVTMLSTELQTASLQQRGQFMGWDPAKMQSERDRVFQEMSTQTKIFLRFYSPELDYDDLHKPKTIWKIYLEQQGKRYEGKIRKLNEKFVELKVQYPHFDRFSSPYEVTFPVPTNSAESGPVKIIMTSSLGSAEFNFD